MICRYCGKTISDDAVFCPFCGRKTESHLRAEDSYVEEADFEAEVRSESEAERAPRRRRSKKSRIKVLISILAAMLFVVIIFLVIMIAAKDYLGEEPWDDGTDQTAQTEIGTDDLVAVKTMYVSSQDGLVLRNSPSEDSDSIHILNYGQEVKVEKTENDWAFVNAEGVYGWCSAKYLTEEKIEAEKKEKTPKTDEDKGRLVEPSTRIKNGIHGVVNADGGLNLRCGPGQDYNIILVVPYEAEVVEEGRDGDWMFIKYDGEYGWVYSEYITPMQAD